MSEYRKVKEMNNKALRTFLNTEDDGLEMMVHTTKPSRLILAI